MFYNFFQTINFIQKFNQIGIKSQKFIFKKKVSTILKFFCREYFYYYFFLYKYHIYAFPENT